MGPDASASNVTASATANVTSLARSPWNDGVGGLHCQGNDQTASGEDRSAAASATVNHHQNTPQNQTKTQRHTTHENCLTLLSEALKEEVITLPRQRPDCIWRSGEDGSRRIQSSRFRNSKPPSEHAPKPDKNAAPQHPRKLPNVAFWSPKRRSYYTAKATTRLHLEKMGPDASKAAACATVNHHQNTPQNQTKTQRHTTHENCLTLLSEALKEEVITLPRQRPDCIWRR